MLWVVLFLLYHMYMLWKDRNRHVAVDDVEEWNGGVRELRRVLLSSGCMCTGQRQFEGKSVSKHLCSFRCCTFERETYGIISFWS